MDIADERAFKKTLNLSSNLGNPSKLTRLLLDCVANFDHT